MCELAGCTAAAVVGCEGCDFALCKNHAIKLPPTDGGIRLHTCAECMGTVVRYEIQWGLHGVKKADRDEGEYNNERKKIKGVDEAAKSKVKCLQTRYNIEKIKQSRVGKLRYIKRLERFVEKRKHAK